MAKWMTLFVSNFVAANNGREPSKNEIKMATPLFLNIDHNPKGKGSMAWDRFNGYFEGGTTIGEVMRDGVRQDDIRHDSDKRFILLGDEAVEAYEAEALAEKGETQDLIEGETQDAEFEVVEPAGEVALLEAPKTRGRKAK